MQKKSRENVANSLPTEKPTYSLTAKKVMRVGGVAALEHMSRVGQVSGSGKQHHLEALGYKKQNKSGRSQERRNDSRQACRNQ